MLLSAEAIGLYPIEILALAERRSNKCRDLDPR